jgi:hypothetical protein
VNGKEVEVSGAGLLLLRRSELNLEETPALDELISLLRLESVVPRDLSELHELARTVGMEWAVDFACGEAAPASDADLDDLTDFAVVTPMGDQELADVFELETAVSSPPPAGGTFEKFIVPSGRLAERDRRAVPVHECEAVAMA